jgi:hypothetical protein
MIVDCVSQRGKDDDSISEQTARPALDTLLREQWNAATIILQP